MTPAEEAPARGADERFERCFRDHYASVLAFAMRRVEGRAAAEDAAAEAFAVVWRRRERMPEPPLPWIYGVALRVIANQRRAARRRRNLDDRLVHEAGAGGGGVDPQAAVERRDAFSAAFARLSEGEREVLRLVAWDGLGPAEAARVLGCSTGAFRVRLHRARRRLAKQLRASGHFPSEAGATDAWPAEEAS